MYIYYYYFEITINLYFIRISTFASFHRKKQSGSSSVQLPHTRKTEHVLNELLFLVTTPIMLK